MTVPVKMSTRTNQIGGITHIADIQYHYEWDTDHEVTHKEARDFLLGKHSRQVNKEVIELLKKLWEDFEVIKLASSGFSSNRAEAAQKALRKEIYKLEGVGT